MRGPGRALVVAPHLLLPPRTGGNVLAFRQARALSRLGWRVDVLGASVRILMEEGEVVRTESIGARPRKRETAALRTLLLRTHFLQERFVTPGARRALRRILQGREDPPKLVLASFLYSALFLQNTPDVGALHGRGTSLLVETHNNELEWFANMAARQRTPLGQWAAANSEKWVRRTLPRLHPAFRLVFLTREDREAYRPWVPDPRALVAPVGVEVAGGPGDGVPGDGVPGDGVPGYGVPGHLLFVGHLGGDMNRAALEHFARVLWPAVRGAPPTPPQVVVAGAEPSREVRGLCRREGWRLEADVEAEALTRLYQGASFALLPFPDTAGSKLKLLEALAHGVPFLATTPLARELQGTPPACLVSDEPEAWARAVARFRREGASGGDREALQALARARSWEARARILVEGSP